LIERALAHGPRAAGAATAERLSADTADAAARLACQQAYREALERRELPPEPVWASEAIDLITDLRPAVNTSLVAADNDRGYAKVYTACSHKVVPVITFGWESDREPNLDDIFQWFNLAARENDAQAVKLLVDEYRSRRNRSLSVGDVI
jgi:hypothetical protein